MANNLSESFNITIWMWIVSITVPAIAGISGVLIGVWRSGRQQKEQRKLEFVKKQLRYFYSPLLGIRKEIQMLSELRKKISKSANKNWGQMCNELREAGGVEYLRAEKNARKDAYDKLINFVSSNYFQREINIAKFYAAFLSVSTSEKSFNNMGFPVFI